MPEAKNEQKEGGYVELQTTKELLGHYRKNIVMARLLLQGMQPSVSDEAKIGRLLGRWLFFIRVLAADYRWQLEQIDRHFEMELK